jgi:hypothetical protein
VLLYQAYQQNDNHAVTAIDAAKLNEVVKLADGSSLQESIAFTRTLRITFLQQMKMDLNPFLLYNIQKTMVRRKEGSIMDTC